MMPGMSLQHIGKVLAATDSLAENAGIGESEIYGVKIDSRLIEPGDLFVAFRGERVDGHSYISTAREQGAEAAIVEELQDDQLVQLRVNDAQSALGQVGRANREKFKGPVVALTGSAGKTGCKNMLAAILQQRFSVCKTEGNLNNELGVPLTLARIDDSHDIAVIEMGAAQQGDIAYLVGLAKPEVAILTNVAEAHIGRFGDIATTAKTKGEIYSALPDGGVAILNADDSFAGYWRGEIANLNRNIRILEFSLENSSSDIYAEDIQLGRDGTTFRLCHRLNARRESTLVNLQVLGRHNVANALAAAAAGLILGCNSSDIKEGLSAVKAAPHRLQLRNAGNDLTIIDDSYNANPQAMLAALDALADVAGNARQVVVFGDMAELGSYAESRHYEVGCEVAKRCVNGQSITAFYVVGNYADQYQQGFASIDAAPDIFLNASSRQKIIEALQTETYRGSTVLVKGSRSAAMEEVVEGLCEAGNEVRTTLC